MKPGDLVKVDYPGCDVHGRVVTVIEYLPRFLFAGMDLGPVASLDIGGPLPLCLPPSRLRVITKQAAA